jgi:hypothetical protein
MKKKKILKRIPLLILIVILGFLFPINSLSNSNSLTLTELNYEDLKGFEKNLGQIRDFNGNVVKDVLLRTSENNLGIFITKKGVSYLIYKFKGEDKEFNILDDSFKNPSLAWARVDLELIGANINESKISFEDEIFGYSNYYFPSFPYEVLFVKAYKKVKINDIYPGINWIWKYENGKLHHEFEISKESDPELIKFKIKFAKVQLKDNKNLILSTPLGEIKDGEIFAYENKEKVKVLYQKEKDLISFKVYNWSKKDKLIIDPPLALLWATYYGGEGFDFSYSINSDKLGNIFITGKTSSIYFPTQDPGNQAYYQGEKAGGIYDIFILKFSPSGIREWATYYGGSKDDVAYSLAVDSDNDIYLTGYTYSEDFPLKECLPVKNGFSYFQKTNAGKADVFILRFSNSGIRKWATYYGGNDFDHGWFIGVDKSDNVFITGYTISNNFPLFNPNNGAYFQKEKGKWSDVFILKFSKDCLREWATFYGGNDVEVGTSISFDEFNNVFITGLTRSTNFPVYNPNNGNYFQGVNSGVTDVFILEFSNSGIRKWATYYGGSSWDNAFSIKIDKFNKIFITGITNSLDFPLYKNPNEPVYFQNEFGGGIYDAFILRFSNNGSLEWSTYYGGNDDDYGLFLNFDNLNNFFIVGYTYSTNFPVYNPNNGNYFQGVNSGLADVFILKFYNPGIRAWATYYGGSKIDRARSLVVSLNKIFITGETTSNNFPTLKPPGNVYYQGYNAGYFDSFILKFLNDELWKISF